jgi:RNA polymerase sigma-70 factor (ECF subfamily)
MEDEQYMRELAEGRNSALDALMYRHHRGLSGFVYRTVGNERVAEDIVQDAFVTVLRQANKGFVPDRFKPWLYKIAVNLCKDYWKKASVRLEMQASDDFEYEALAQDGTANLFERQVERQWIVDSLNRLPLHYRVVLYLRFYQDMTLTEIAETVDLPQGTVKTQLFRGLRKLEQMWKADNESEQKGGRADGKG